MSKFDELINSLKKDIQSLPSAEGRECVVVDDPVAVAAVKQTIHQPQVSPDDIQCADTSFQDHDYEYTSSSSSKNKFSRLFVRHFLLSVEFFVFFFILLLITKPPFLYYSERVNIGRREFLRTHFSTFYLFSYSLFFTLISHLLIFIHKDLVKRY